MRAALLGHYGDLFASLTSGGGEAWTPSVTQGATPTQTPTTGSYFRIGRLIAAIFVVTIGSGTTGTANNAVVLNLPFTAVRSTDDAGQGHIYDASASAIYWATLHFASTTTVNLWGTTSTGLAALGGTGAAFTAALANTDSVEGTLLYEAAT